MQLHPLENFLSKIWQIWTKGIEIWTNLIRFGQNQNLASPKTFDLLRLWVIVCIFSRSHKLQFRWAPVPKPPHNLLSVLLTYAHASGVVRNPQWWGFGGVPSRRNLGELSDFWNFSLKICLSLSIISKHLKSSLNVLNRINEVQAL